MHMGTIVIMLIETTSLLQDFQSKKQLVSEIYSRSSKNRTPRCAAGVGDRGS